MNEVYICEVLYMGKVLHLVRFNTDNEGSLGDGEGGGG